MASKETRFKSKISIQCGYCKVSMRKDRLSEHTRQQHPGLPIKERGQTSLTILSRKRPHDREDEGETNPTAQKKRPMDQMKHNLAVLLLLAKVQVEQIATEIQSADSERQIPHNLKNLIVAEVKQLNQNHQIPKLM